MSQETVFIDGKWYDEECNEVPAPVIRRARKTATAHGVTFIEGESYENHFGVYEVNEILEDGKKMDVSYLEVKAGSVVTGCSYVYPVAAQAETIANEKAEKEAKMRLLGTMEFGEGDDFLLTYLKKNGRFNAAVPPKSVKAFNEEYAMFTGHLPEDHEGHGYYIDERQPGKPESWGVSMSISFPLCDEVFSYLPAGQHITQSDGRGSIVSNAFCRGLLKKGFELGSNKDNDKISVAA